MTLQSECKKRREVTAQKALCTVRIERGNGNGGGEGRMGQGSAANNNSSFSAAESATGRRQGSQQTRRLFLSVSCSSSVLARAQKERYRCRRRRAKATGVGGAAEKCTEWPPPQPSSLQDPSYVPLPTFFSARANNNNNAEHTEGKLDTGLLMQQQHGRDESCQGENAIRERSDKVERGNLRRCTTKPAIQHHNITRMTATR